MSDGKAAAKSPNARRRGGAGVAGQFVPIGWGFLKPRIGRMMDAADDRLFEMAGKTSSGRDQRNFFDAMRLVRLKRNDFESTWHSLWAATADGAADAVLHKPREDEIFALLGKEEHEEEVALHAMSVRAEEIFSRPLADLALRMSRLPALQQAIGNPFVPPVLCELCRQAAGVFEISIEARLVLYKLFERFVIQDLAQLYREALATFAQAGIRDVADTPKAARRSTARQAGERQTAANPQQDVTYDELINLLRQSAGGAGESSRGQIGRVELLNALESIQVGELDTAVSIGSNRQSLRDVVLRSSPVGGRLPAQAEQDTLTLVSMLFDVILEDQRLAAPMRAQIARLQIPVLKVALHDRQFFSNSRHPIRQLLNEVFRAVVGWVPGEDIDKDPLFKTVGGLVEKIVGENADTAVFDAMLEEFRGYTERELRRADLLQQRMEEAARAKAKTRRARQHTRECLKELLGERMLTPAMDVLIRAGLQRALYMAALREGVDGVEWQRAQSVLIDLLSWFDGGRDDAAAVELCERSRQVLGQAGIDATNVERLLAILTAPSISAVLAPEEPLVEEASARIGEVDKILAEEPEEPPENNPGLDLAAHADDEPEPRYVEAAASLTRGCWIELTDDAQRVQRCRLAIVLEAAASFLFVTRTGQRALECTQLQLARLIQAGRVKVLDERELFDTALETVISNLRHSGRAA